jgi:hypothetical protein
MGGDAEGSSICTTVRVRCTSTSAAAVKRFWFSCSTEAKLRIAGLRNRAVPRVLCNNSIAGGHVPLCVELPLLTIRSKANLDKIRFLVVECQRAITGEG